MLSRMSTLLIFMVLLLTPVSYSSEAIPDFAPECTVTQRYHVKLTVAPLDRLIPDATSPAAAANTPAILPPPTLGQELVAVAPLLPGRAPPV